MIKENDFVEDRALRDQSVNHYEVLEKVKQILLIPDLQAITTNQVAEYYEVESSTVNKICQRYADELKSDGMHIEKMENFLKGQNVTFQKERNKVTLTYNNGIELLVTNRGTRVFPRRAILRVGMLLRDSTVAKEVRTQLLNIEEKTSDKTKIQDINEEQRLMLNVGMAYASGNVDAMMKATTEYNAFQNRHIAKLQNDNKALAGEILEWKDRGKLNAGVRKLAYVTGQHWSKIWNELYKNLQYKYGICLKQRGGQPYVQWIKESEWDKVIQTFSAMCEAYEQSPTEMFQQTVPVGTLVSANK